MEKTGERAMVAAGLNIATGQFNTRPRRCQCCKGESVHVESAVAHYRIYGCDDCGALELSTLSRPVPDKPGAFYGGWQHGARQPDDWPPAMLATFRGLTE